MLRLVGFGSRAAAPATDPVDSLHALVGPATAGDRQAQRTLLVALGPLLLRTARAVLGGSNPDVEDALQESMAAVITGLPRFRGECTVRHYASRVAVQTALNMRRRARTRALHVAPASDDELASVSALEPSPAEISDATRRREALSELLHTLPEIHSEVLALHVMLGFTIDEAADALSVPANTVRSRLRRALAALRDTLREDPASLELLREEL